MRGSGQLHLRRQDDKAQLIRVKGMDIDKIIKEVMEQVHAQSTASAVITDMCCDAFEVPSRLEHSLLNPDVCVDKIREEGGGLFAGFERKGMRGDWFSAWGDVCCRKGG